jgi:hypothetical protein
MAEEHEVTARLARAWTIGAGALLLSVGRAEARRWRRLYRVLRDGKRRRAPVERCSNWLCALPDEYALAATLAGDASEVQRNFADRHLAAGACVRARLRPIVHRDGGDLHCRLSIVELWPFEPPPDDPLLAAPLAAVFTTAAAGRGRARPSTP